MNSETDLFAQNFKIDRRVWNLVSRSEITAYSITTLTEENVEYTRENLLRLLIIY